MEIIPYDPIKEQRSQLHKRVSEFVTREILKQYIQKEIKAKEAQKILGLKKSAFYDLVRKYRTTDQVAYARHTPNRGISQETKQAILQEFTIEKEKIIDNPAVPTNRYNYSFIHKLLPKEYTTSLPTLIKIAKEAGHTNKPIPKRKHDRIVQTSFVGELVQHDSSHHLFAPLMGIKLYLITSLDDYSRMILYGNFFLEETSWHHIEALAFVAHTYGFVHQYYPDSHTIFRYVKDRDTYSPDRVYTTFTDEVETQFKKVLTTCDISLIYALSPQAKGKIERPYQWLQDHLVRRCVRENVTTLEHARRILYEEISQYNNRIKHSTTGEIPIIRFNRAIKEAKTLIRPYAIPFPYTSSQDIFCITIQRRVDGYRYISLDGTKIKLCGVDPLTSVDIHISPLTDVMLLLRIWDENHFIQEVTIHTADLTSFRF